MIQSKVKDCYPCDNIVYGKIFYRPRVNNFKANCPIWPNIVLFRDFMPVLITCKFEEDLIEDLIQPVPKSYAAYSPPPPMLHIKFEQD